MHNQLSWRNAFCYCKRSFDKVLQVDLSFTSSPQFLHLYSVLWHEFPGRLECQRHNQTFWAMGPFTHISQFGAFDFEHRTSIQTKTYEWSTKPVELFIVSVCQSVLLIWIVPFYCCIYCDFVLFLFFIRNVSRGWGAGKLLQRVNDLFIKSYGSTKVSWGGGGTFSPMGPLTIANVGHDGA